LTIPIIAWMVRLPGRALRLVGHSVSLPRALLVACVVVAVWLVLVPLFGADLQRLQTRTPASFRCAFSLDNFVEAYS